MTQISINFLKSPSKSFVLAIITAAILRIIFDLNLSHNGFFFFTSAYDSLSRTYLSCMWANHPFFSTPPAIWTPFQFVIVGTIFRIIHPFYSDCYPLIPAVVNFVFFLGSISIIYYLSYRFYSSLAGWISVLIITTQAYDVWVTFSGLSEPISIFFMLMIILLFYMYVNSKHKKNLFVYLMGITALILSATHTSGWFYSIFVAGFCSIFIFKQLREFYSENKQRKPQQNLKPYFITVFLSLIFPVIWLYNNWIVNHGHIVTLDQGSMRVFEATIGSMSILTRLVLNSSVIFAIAPVLMIFGSYVIVNMMREKSKFLKYLIPSFIYVVFFLTTAVMGRAAPYQEPRYFVILIWSIIPFVSMKISYLIKNEHRSHKVIGYVILTALIGMGVLHTFEFPNYPHFDEIVQFMNGWLQDHSKDSRIFIETNGLKEQTLIPVASGHPDLFTFPTKNQIENYSDNTLISQFHNQRNLIIVTNIDTVVKLSPFVNFTGVDDYFVINNKENNKSQINSTVLSWKPLERGQLFLPVPSNIVIFGFHDADPVNREQVGIEKNFDTYVNNCYTLKVKVRDGYSDKNYPGRIEQQILIDGKTYWQHDISGDPVNKGPLLSMFQNSSFIKYDVEPALISTIPISTYEGWQNLTINFTAATNTTNVKILLDANNVEKGWAWGSVSQTVIKDPNLLHC